MKFKILKHENKVNFSTLNKRLVLAIAILSLYACSSVKEYQKSKINDAEMVLTAKKTEKFENTFQLYREASSGANGGKTGGGCGCN
jgi:outer membrane biogenesis lipoprotein LolB